VFRAAIENAGIQCDLQRDGHIAVVVIHPVAARPGVNFARTVAEQPSPPTGTRRFRAVRDARRGVRVGRREPAARSASA
jgi:hypothetical protein